MILYNKVPSLNGDETQKVFRIGIDSCNNDDIVVEVGCYVGGMTIYMCDLVSYSKKNINFYVVDSFAEKQYLDNDVPMYDRFYKNTEAYTNKFQLYKKDSLECSTEFKDNSIQFLFLDTAHDSKYVKKELDVWIPKMKKGGVIAGHDYHWNGISELLEYEIGKVNVVESCIDYIWEGVRWKHTAWWKKI